MSCPRCSQVDFSPAAPCPACGFSGAPDSLQALSNLNYLLEELGTWHTLPPPVRKELQEKYKARRRRVQVDLGLREPPLDADGAHAARLELVQLEALKQAVQRWARQGCLTATAAPEIDTEIDTQAHALRDRLLDAPRTEPPPPAQLILLQLRFLSARLDQLHDAGRLAGEPVYAALAAELAAAVELQEIALGLRQRPAPAPRPPAPAPASAAPAPASSHPTRPPLTWERAWELLLSERTLRAILFLGAGLVFAAAVSLVVWNWNAFSPWLQVAFLALFTGIFYALGWYVRARLKLRGSGIALSAVASLLVPLDFYAFYLSGGLPRERWPEVWLATSAVCLLAYLLTVYLIQAEFFGYLVGVAAGSLLAAGMQVGGVPPAWWQAALTALALLLALAAEGLLRREGRWRLLAAPLWRLALLAGTTIPVLAFGWAFTGRVAERAFFAALALDWWLGGALLVLAARRHRRRSAGLGAAACFPMAVWLTQRVLFRLWGVEMAWHALGWALLAPPYLVAGRRLLLKSRDEAGRAYGRIATAVGGGLVAFTALWALLDATAAAVVHPLLAATVVLAAVLWRRPWLSPAASLLLVSGTAVALGSRGATLAQVGLAWALLSILHVVVALRLGRTAAGPAYAAPVYLAGWAIAGLSLLPPLFALHRPTLTYVLGHWMALNAWLAYLAHGRDAPGLQVLLSLHDRRTPRHAARSPRCLIFHWAAALPLPVWVWLVWAERWPAEARLGLAYAAATWLLLALYAWLRRRRWAYGSPWLAAAHLCTLMAVFVPLAFYDQGWAALALLLASAFYFTVARVSHRQQWLAVGGLVLPIGAILGLDHLGVQPDRWGLALALVVLLYVGAAACLERLRGVQRRFLLPLYSVIPLVALLAFTFCIAPAFRINPDRAASLWAAAGQFALALSFGTLAWRFRAEIAAHAAVWLAVAAGGLVALAFGRRTGSSAFEAALLAAAFVLVERALQRACLALRVPLPWRPVVRRAWRLYRRPLLLAGWTLTLGAIGLALLRNLALLGGGRLRETWAAAGLLTVTALYALAARLFRKARFVWFAAILVIAPWTVLTHLCWWYFWLTPRYPLAWAVLALLELLIGIGLEEWLGAARTWLRGPVAHWSAPPQVVAYLLLPFALLWSVANVATAAATYGLALAFYLLALWADWRRRAPAAPPRARFLYPAAALLPIWSVYLLAHFAPGARQVHSGLLLLAFALPALLLGRWLERRVRGYGRPLYLVACACAIVGTALVAHQRPALALALLLDTLLALLSAGIFREPLWVYPASAALPAALVLLLVEWRLLPGRHGWALIALGGLYLLLARWLRDRRPWLHAYAAPLLAAAFALVALGLPPSSSEHLTALVAYAAAAALYTLAAVWLQQPLLLTPAVGLAGIAFWVALLRLGLPPLDRGLALWLPIAACLLLAHHVDRRWGVQPDADGAGLPPFLWTRPAAWLRAAGERALRWWALPLYAAGYAGAALSAALAWNDPARRAVLLLLAAGVYGLATARFRLRGWLLLAAGTLQLAALSAIDWIGWRHDPAWSALAFAPVTWLTAAAGLIVQRRLGEGSPLGGGLRGLLRCVLRGWSCPLYVLLLADLLGSYVAAFALSGAAVWVYLSQAVLLGLLATAWAARGLAYLPPVAGLVTLFQWLMWRGADGRTWAWTLALLALGYGLAGYLLRFLRQRGVRLPPSVAVWGAPLRLGGWLISVLGLGLALFPAGPGSEVAGWLLRAVLFGGAPSPVEVASVQALAAVLALVGLLYLTAALVDRRRWLGYAAVAMLLGAWGAEWRLVWGLREVQWYAVPAGLYLLGVGYLECSYGSRSLGRWIDRGALILLLGSSFWQSLGDGGWRYAVLMGAEGLALVGWGSARRVRQLLYAGVVGVTLAAAGQLIDPLLSANRWVVFGTSGILLIILAVIIERRLQAVLSFSHELREQLEKWQ